MANGSNTGWRPSASLAALKTRADILATIRSFFADREVLEVQTPVLGDGTITDPDLEAIAVPGLGFLQTSPEYFQKRLLAAGVPDCYQLGPMFRADESGRLHHTEFTMLEWYRLGFNHHDLMQEVSTLVDAVLGESDYRTMRYSELVGDLERPREELDLAFAEACERLSGRVFITSYPADQAALARLDPDDDSVSARFELVVDGVELANGYWELADAGEHRRRFQSDLEIREKRGLPSKPIDELFLAALDSGLPDCSGVALGVDRLVMKKLGASSIDEVLSFRR